MATIRLTDRQLATVRRALEWAAEDVDNEAAVSELGLQFFSDVRATLASLPGPGPAESAGPADDALRALLEGDRQSVRDHGDAWDPEDPDRCGPSCPGWAIKAGRPIGCIACAKLGSGMTDIEACCHVMTQHGFRLTCGVPGCTEYATHSSRAHGVVCESHRGDDWERI
jgi:hypothetical protein